MEVYNKRFISEYYQLFDRIDKLENVINGNVKTPCPTSLLQHQLDIMKQYQAILQKRADIEHIRLED